MLSKVTILVKSNKTLEFFHENQNSPVPTCSFLLIFLFFGIFLNASILYTIISTTLINKSFNRVIACFSVTLLLECIINITSSITFRSSWEELYTLHEESGLRLFCSLNATSIQFVAVLEMYMVTVFSYERWVVVRGTGREADGVKMKMVVPWVIVGAGVSSLPLRLLPTRYIEQRYCCSPAFVSSKPTQVLTGTLTLLIGFCFPLAIIINSWRFITTNTLQERRRVNSLTLPLSQNPSIHQSPAVTTHNKLAAVLILLYFTLVLPNIIYIQTTQFAHSYKGRKLTDGLLDHFAGNRTELPEELKPIHTSVFDTVCIWGRYSYTIVAPCVVFFLDKHIWKEFKECLVLKQTIGRSVWKRTRRKDEVVDWRVPVLFATSEGIHLRVADGGSDEPKFTILFCDLEETKEADVEEEKEERRAGKPMKMEKETGRERRKTSQRRVSDIEMKIQNEFPENQKKYKESDSELLNTSTTSLLLTLHQRIRPRDL